MALVPRVLFGSFSQNIAKNGFYSRFLLIRLASTEAVQNEPASSEKEAAAIELEAKRNKSRLKEKHYNIIHGKPPVDPYNPQFVQEETVRFRRRLVARNGQQTGVNLGIAWPTREELDEMIEYEKVAHPMTVQEMIAKRKKIREDEEMKTLKRQKDIEVKVGKLAGWMKELSDRQNKKIAVAKAAQDKKDRLIEEVRQHFGYVVSMNDPKFQEMIEQKEKEARKAEKEQKKKDRFEKVTAKARAEIEAASKQKTE